MCFHAIDVGHLTNWPHLTSKILIQHIPEITSMLKGHMYQTRANNQSTQPPPYVNSEYACLTQVPVPAISINPDVLDRLLIDYSINELCR